MSSAIVVVISNNSSSGVLQSARALGIPAFHLSLRQFPDHTAYQTAILETLNRHQVNFIVLAGYMKKLDSRIINAFPGRIINIHPALLPKFGGEGMYGMHVHTAVIRAGERESGATVHFVSAEYDTGDIIDQVKVPVHENDTPEILAARVLEAEHRLLPSVVKKFALQSEKT